MAYVELSYYRDCALELREYGDAGWAVHVYEPRLSRKIGMVSTTRAAALTSVMAEAQAVVDRHLAASGLPAAPPPPPRTSRATQAARA